MRGKLASCAALQHTVIGRPRIGNRTAWTTCVEWESVGTQAIKRRRPPASPPSSWIDVLARTAAHRKFLRRPGTAASGRESTSSDLDPNPPSRRTEPNIHDHSKPWSQTKRSGPSSCRQSKTNGDRRNPAADARARLPSALGSVDVAGIWFGALSPHGPHISLHRAALCFKSPLAQGGREPNGEQPMIRRHVHCVWLLLGACWHRSRLRPRSTKRRCCASRRRI